MEAAPTTKSVTTPAPQFPTRTVHLDGDVISYTFALTSDQMWLLHDTMLNTEIVLEMSVCGEDKDTWTHKTATKRIAESKRLRLALMGITKE